MASSATTSSTSSSTTTNTTTTAHPAALLLDDLFSRAQLSLSVEGNVEDQDQDQDGDVEQGSEVDENGGSKQKQVAFYDEALRPRIQLYLPASAALPSPDPTFSASSLTFPLPLPLQEPEEEPDAQDSEYNHETTSNSNLKLPKIVSILLSSLQLNLEASYVSPHPIVPPPNHASSFPSSTSTANPETITQTNSNSNFNPLPTVPINETGYQLQASSSQSFQNSNPPLNLSPMAMQHYQNSFPATFHSSSWFGHKQPPLSSKDKKIDSEEKSDLDKIQSDFSKQSYVSWIAGKNGSKGRWKVSWQAETPVVYVRSRHNNPLITLTASLSLRISSHLLSILLPLSKSNKELSTSFPTHDFLTNLSSGPIYPDESPLEKSSRLNKNSSNLSNLPLENLGNEILETNLITLEKSRESIFQKTMKIKESLIPLPHEIESDLADFGSHLNSNSDKRNLENRRKVDGIDEFDLSDVGGKIKSSNVNTVDQSKESQKNKGIGSEVRTIRRSCRRTLDVRSAILVRMRTLLAPPLVKIPRQENEFEGSEETIRKEEDNLEEADDDLESESESDQDSDSETEFELLAARDTSLERALVLCVELENPSDSGVKFEVRKCSINIEGGTEDRNIEISKKTQAKLNATLLKDENTKFPMILNQGQQVNALYYVELNLGEEELINLIQNQNGIEDVRNNQRHVTIVVDGRPLILKDGVSKVETDIKGYNLSSEEIGEIQDQINNPSESKNSSSSSSYFSSTWNCQIDTTVLQNALNRRRAASIHNLSIKSLNSSQKVNISSSSNSILAGDHQFSASSLARSLAEEAARFQVLSSNSQNNTPQGRKGSVSPIPPKSPMSSNPPNISNPGPSNLISQRRDTLTVDSPIGISPTRGRLASLTDGTIRPFSPTSMTPRSSSFGLGPPPMMKISNGTMITSSIEGGRTPSGGVGLGLLASARNRASSLQLNSNSNGVSNSEILPPNSSQTPITLPQQQKPFLERLTSFNSPKSPISTTPLTSVPPSNNLQTSSWSFKNGSNNVKKDVLPWTSSSGPSVANLSRGINHKQGSILISTKVEINKSLKSNHFISKDFETHNRNGASIPIIKVLESFSLVVLIFNRNEVENRNFLISWPLIELNSDGEFFSSKEKENQPNLSKGPRSSLIPNSNLLNKNRLLDAEGARRAHIIVESSQLRSALLPEENHLLIGPILPETCESIHLPVRALVPGIHPVAPAGLVITDTETGEERRIWDVGNVVVVKEE